MGRPYMVTEDCNSKSPLVGKPVKKGYDSHYVLLSKHKSEKKICRPPSTPFDHVEMTPTKDEIMVPSNEQV